MPEVTEPTGFSEGMCHEADCLEAMKMLPDRSIDHIITDPPYGETTHSGQVQVQRQEHSRHLESVSVVPALSFEPLNDESRVLYALEFARIAKSWVVVFAEAEQVGRWKSALEYAGCVYKRACIWVKPNAMPQFSGDRPGQGYEAFVCAWCSPGRSRWNGGGKSGNYVHPIPRGENRYHETQKPMGLMMEIVNDFTNPGDLILDPFAGSGTTLIAAKKLERRFMGFEMNEDYCDVANQRLSDPMFLPERLRSSQLILL